MHGATAAIPSPARAKPASAGATPPHSTAIARLAPASALPRITTRASPQRFRHASEKIRATTIETENTAIPIGVRPDAAFATFFRYSADQSFNAPSTIVANAIAAPIHSVVRVGRKSLMRNPGASSSGAGSAGDGSGSVPGSRLGLE